MVVVVVVFDIYYFQLVIFYSRLFTVGFLQWFFTGGLRCKNKFDLYFYSAFSSFFTWCMSEISTVLRIRVLCAVVIVVPPFLSLHNEKNMHYLLVVNFSLGGDSIGSTSIVPCF